MNPTTRCASGSGAAPARSTPSPASAASVPQIIRDDAVDHILLVYRCDGRWDGRTWRWAVPITADELARDGLVELAGLLPAPEPITTPPAGQSSIATVPVFVWTDPAAWTPFDGHPHRPAHRSERHRHGDPVDDALRPGRRRRARRRAPAPASATTRSWPAATPPPRPRMPGRCAHAYDQLTRNVDGTAVAGRPPAWRATLSVDWDVTWTATNGQSGQLRHDHQGDHVRPGRHRGAGARHRLIDVTKVSEKRSDR